MSIFDIANTLKSYMNVNPSAPPENVQQDFQQVAQTAPQQHIATGLSQAFNSNQGGGFPQMLSSMFSQSNGQQRAGILSELLATAGPTLGGSLLQHFSGLGGSTQVTPEQAQQIPPEAVQQLAQHAQQQDPSVVDRASSFYAQHPQVVQALGAGALALVMSHLSRQQF